MALIPDLLVAVVAWMPQRMRAATFKASCDSLNPVTHWCSSDLGRSMFPLTSVEMAGKFN
jgi:hypothetical protein